MFCSKNIKNFYESLYGECTQSSSGNLILVHIGPLAVVSYMKHKKEKKNHHISPKLLTVQKYAF